MPARIDRTGQTYNRLTFVKRVDAKQWECRCSCGRTYIGVASAIACGNTKSCGCLNLERIRERNTRHGFSLRGVKNATYHAWVAMRQRCYNTKGARYALYGGRGIRVCDRWRSDFAAFLADMGERPSPRHSLDRIDVNGHYEPGNCRWVTQVEQVRNQRRTIYVTFNGQRMCLKDACVAAGLTYGAVQDRIRRGWPESDWLLPKLETWSRQHKHKEQDRVGNRQQPPSATTKKRKAA